MSRRPGGNLRSHQSATSEWTVGILREHFQRQLDDLRVLLDERYATQTKALDAAFASQQTATQTAIQSQERAVQTAMDASEKAGAKAEVAAEKRFEGLNELRKVVEAVGSLQMPRGEAEQRLRQLSEKIDELKTAASTRDGRSAGLSAGWVLLAGAVGVLAVVAGHVKFH